MITRIFTQFGNASYSLWKGLVAILAVQAALPRDSNAKELNKDEIIINDPYLNENNVFISTSSFVHSNLNTQPAKPLEITFSFNELIKEVTMVRSHEISEVSSKLEEISSLERRMLEKALFAASNDATLNLIIKKKVQIHIVNEAVMKSLTNLDTFAACYGLQTNVIYLNEYLFEDTPLRQQQLITLLANELSHATITNKKTQSASTFKEIVPWTIPEEEKAFKEAYNDFKKNIAEYENLIKKQKAKQKLTKREEIRIKLFDKAMEDYLPPAFGIEGFNANQARVTSSKNGRFTFIFNESNTLSSANTPEKRLDYLRQNFFTEFQNKKILNDASHESQIGIYENDADQLFADELSDFESLSPTMRQTFGKNLCDLLNNYFEVTDHCVRPNWPKRAV